MSIQFKDEKSMKKALALMKNYDLDRRVTNVIPVGAGGVGTVDFNTLADDVASNNIVILAVGATRFIPASFPCRRITVLADAANAGNVLIGDRNPQFPLIPGAGMTIAINDASQLYFNGAIADILYYLIEKFGL